jgi:DNA-binding response OmpR family regulator
MNQVVPRDTEDHAPILIVDDDWRVRQTLRWTLEDEGFATVEAVDVQQALEIVEQVRPGLVLLDYTLPDGDGSVVAEALQARPGGAPRILLITADGRASEKARLVGAFAHLSKPFDLDELVLLVRQGLSS